MKQIPLTQNKVAIVDDKDFVELSKYKWYFAQGYAVRNSPPPQRKIFMHRIILNPTKGKIIDHINGDSLDNRQDNLRMSTVSENQHNQKVRKNISGYKGVHWHKRIKKWHAKIKVEMNDIHLGYFSDRVEAAKAYNKGAKLYHGEFAKLNFI
jgi:hypothetical protein